MTTLDAGEPRQLDPNVETWALEYPGRLSQDALHELRFQLREQMPDKRVIVVQDGGRFRSLSPLDAAWAEAEAVLPEGWRGPILRRSSVVDGQYQAQAFDPDEADVYEYAATPAAALRALAEALRKPVPA